MFKWTSAFGKSVLTFFKVPYKYKKVFKMWLFKKSKKSELERQIEILNENIEMAAYHARWAMPGLAKSLGMDIEKKDDVLKLIICWHEMFIGEIEETLDIKLLREAKIYLMVNSFKSFLMPDGKQLKLLEGLMAGILDKELKVKLKE